LQVLELSAGDHGISSMLLFLLIEYGMVTHQFCYPAAGQTD